MPAQPRIPPVWMMGLTDLPFGMVSTFTVTTLPQLLAAQGIPGGHIAAMTAFALSPGWWAFLFSPMLDVRFRRRTYALLLGFVAATAVAYITFDHHNLLMVEIAAFTGNIASALYQGAVGGWTGSLIHKEQDALLSSWFIAACIGAGGLMALAGEPIIQHLPPALASALMFAIVAAPMAFFIAIPAPEPDKVLAAESFGRFWREVFSLFKRRQVLIAMVLFIFPSASFALTNVIAGLGGDYHVSADVASFLLAVGYIVAGVAGIVVVPLLAKRFPLRPVYLGIGVAGALFTLSSLLLPRTPFAFAAVFAGELIFQSLALTTATGIIFQVIGPDNPLAATTFTVLTSVMIVPIFYMGIMDGWSYDSGGLVGCYAVDAGLGLAACLLLAYALRRWLFAPRAQEPETESA
ncbi:MAG TPA: MFS transporter [Terracidiphilus sp.]|nr:MFS transporter [Terracidiphilus sp.]